MKYNEPIKLFSRNLGVAFQILNDLDDWNTDNHNKLVAGSDALGGRPTILWALALESLPEEEKQELLSLVQDEQQTPLERIERVRQLYLNAGVFDKALQLVDKHQQRAEKIADDIQPEDLRRLFYYLIDTVLERPGEITFTRMFLGANSEANPLARPITPILAAETWARWAVPLKAPSPVKKTTLP